MDKNKIHDEIVVDESRKLYNILNFQDFMLEESKKDKKEPKKCKKLIKNREEYIDDMDIIDPNECPERYVKLREEFIREDYKQRGCLQENKPLYNTIHFSRFDHPSKEDGFILPSSI